MKSLSSEDGTGYELEPLSSEYGSYKTVKDQILALALRLKSLKAFTALPLGLEAGRRKTLKREIRDHTGVPHS